MASFGALWVSVGLWGDASPSSSPWIRHVCLALSD